jgi:predicted NodU family carbamoyl transferase
MDRIYGFKYSLGMFYQYATAFCGMQMHNHEYKMLAYETRIGNILVSVSEINDYIDEFSKRCMDRILKGLIDKRMDPVTSLDALFACQTWVNETLQTYLEVFGFENSDTFQKRVMVSYFAQRYVENIVRWIIERLAPTNVLLVGGVFLNVKINHQICNMIPGKFCVTPLSGDQGAAIGVYHTCVQELQWPDHLFWGHRSLDYYILDDEEEGLIIAEDESEAEEIICEELINTGFVNVVRGSMEFGPRALCNTTTLARPEPEVGELVNRMNDRTNEMPFALVTTRGQAKEMFEDIDKVHKSLEYMIMARKFKDGQHLHVQGGAHYYPLIDEYTCRPQITNDPMMCRLLAEHGPLINTSWNYHGVPIVNTTEQVQYTHYKERNALLEVDFKTIIIKEK